MLVGRNPKDALLPIAILAVSGIVSYERAKAESLGFSARGGLMERAERLIFLGFAFVFHVVLVPFLVVLLVLTCATAIGRFYRVWIQASDENVDALAFAGLRGVVGESRWRAW
jgi:CDP-diacylglycerol--glycerol-3-phosphate 3-phosphatidyltransferase